MGYIIGIFAIGLSGGLLIWLKTKRRKYLIIYALIILLLLVLPWAFMLLAFAIGAEFPD